MTTIHVITHTHWDRDWFLPKEFINEWLDDLFERLFRLIEAVPDYRYVLDGQTSVIDDYLARNPTHRSKIAHTAQAGNLLIGPYFGQVDWRVVSEESLMRNLYIGITDARKYGNLMTCGWVVDNFGHCSQSPQIHTLFGIEDIYLWRGPVFEKDEICSEFNWQGSDGSIARVHYLLSGYRNFYNLTDTAEHIDARIDQMIDLLRPYSPSGQLIFLDGYDIDVWPEDPFEFLQDSQLFVRSTPQDYAESHCAAPGTESIPVLKGELYSGKYASVFPGSLSSRMYLRIQNALIERLLTYYLEPLQALLNNAGLDTDIEETLAMWKDLIGTQLHDCIGGVSVDQVHDHMEAIYKKLYDQIKERLEWVIGYLPSLLDLEKGVYAFMPSPYAYESLLLCHGQSVHRVCPEGCGIYKLDKVYPQPDAVPIDHDFIWKNDHFTFKINRQGCWLNQKPIGRLLLEKDNGDTYSADPSPLDPPPQVNTIRMSAAANNDTFVIITLEREISHGDIHITTEEKIFLCQSPVVDWQMTVDSRGTDYRLRVCYDTQDAHSPVYAKMPFDILERPREDKNYYSAEIPVDLEPLLLAAREVNSVKDFPFQGFVTLAGIRNTRAVFARGLREYAVDHDGTIGVTLKRAVQWLAKFDLSTRVGDAGPYMYTPGARDQRKTRFELGFIDLEAPLHSERFLKWFYLFEYGYVCFENRTFEGSCKASRIWEEALPWSGIQSIAKGRSIVRVYNPYDRVVSFSRTCQQTNAFVQDLEEVRELLPKKIGHLIFRTPNGLPKPTSTAAHLTYLPSWPAGEDASPPQVARLEELRKKKLSYQRTQEGARKRLLQINQAKDPLAYHRVQHEVVRLEREILELELSILLNQMKFGNADADLYDKVRKIGRRTNLARRNRRTYDYILSLFEHAPDHLPKSPTSQ
jgi:alpha-mannosidase